MNRLRCDQTPAWSLLKACYDADGKTFDLQQAFKADAHRFARLSQDAPYVFADFINPDGAAYAARYRDEFCSSAALNAPRMVVAGWAICAETDEEAQRIASSARMTRALLNRGELIPVPPIEKALQFLKEHGSNADTVARPRRAIIGSPATVKKGIEALADAYGAEEVMIVTITYEHADRRRSYELIAEAFGLV